MSENLHKNEFIAFSLMQKVCGIGQNRCNFIFCTFKFTSFERGLVGVA